MDPLRPYPPVQRYDYPNSWPYRFGLLVLTAAWLLAVLLPSGSVALTSLRADAGLTAEGWGAMLRFVGMALSTALLVVAVVRDFRGQQPFYRSLLFPAATLLLVASMLLPRLV